MCFSYVEFVLVGSSFGLGLLLVEHISNGVGWTLSSLSTAIV